MLPSRRLQLAALQQLLSGVGGSGSSTLPAPAAAGHALAAAAAGHALAAAAAAAPAAGGLPAQLQHASSSSRRAFAADAAAVERSSSGAEGEEDIKQAAHEMGLDAVPFDELKRMMLPAAAAAATKDSLTVVSRGTANTSKLVWGDLPGYQQLLDEVLASPGTYALPTAPALDAGLWADTHFKEVGLGMEPRGDFYVWRAWAAQHLPPDQLETMLAMEQVMGDEITRASLIKQSQHELARLWDWQHRRVALGLSPDLPQSPAAAAAADQSGAGASGPGSQAAAAAASDALQQQEAAAAAAAVDSSASESELSSDDEAAAGAGEQAPPPPMSLADVLALAEAQQPASAAAAQGARAGGGASAAAAAASAAEAVLAGAGSSSSALAAAAAAAGVPLVEDVVDRTPAQQHPLLAKWAKAEQAHQIAIKQVETMLARGQSTAAKGKNRYMTGVPLRQYKPVFDDGDLFLPSKPFGSRQVAATLADAAATTAVDPTKVAAQAAAVAAAAARAAHAGLALPLPAAAAAAGGDASAQAGGVQDMACWTSMPLLDRTVLREESIKKAVEKLAARPKATKRWQLLQDGYAFDLQARPPTRALDLIAGYLEVRYADVLLRKDAVQTTQRALALQALQSRGGGSELAEGPPAALAAAACLSQAERDAVTATLDGLLGGKQYGQYREVVLQLYCNGLITWGELQECWAAAQAGEELTTAAEAPVGGIADDRQQLFRLLSGQQQLPEGLGAAASTSPADEAAARKAWAAAGKKLQGSGDDAPVSYEEAAALWQQALTLAGQRDGPRFEQVLLAGSDEPQLRQQLQGLQEALQRVTGLSPAGVQQASSSSSPAELKQQLQQLFEAPGSLAQLLQQHWDKVAEEELGQRPPSSSSGAAGDGGASAAAAVPSWGQLWGLLQQLTRHMQQQSSAAAAAAGGAVAAEGTPVDAADMVERYLREADGVPITPPPYPGARRLLQWEQRLVLHAASGDKVLPAELKVKLAVSAAELAHEAGLSTHGLQYLLAIVGKRYNADTGVLTLACDRFPTREENRRWCLEVLHRLLAAADARFPAPGGKRVDSSAVLGAGQPAAVQALLSGGSSGSSSSSIARG